MQRKDYDRYEIYRNDDGTIDQLPFVNIPINQSDKYEKWIAGSSRLDIIAKRLYGNEFYDFLILMANPQYIDQFEIQDDVVIRIPFPLQKAVMDYENGLNKIRNR